MSVCGHRVFLVVTQSIEGTATNVARRRVELTCTLAEGHDGAHHDADNNERWESRPGPKQTIFRHEDEEP